MIALNDWKDAERNDILRDFLRYGDKGREEAFKIFDGVNILFASYGYANYSGDAFILFEKEGGLFEVNGSHCSCYGLEGQWEPTPVSIEELEHRLKNGRLGQDDWCGNQFADELKVFLNEFKQKASEERGAP